jgi:hypothetical protein
VVKVRSVDCRHPKFYQSCHHLLFLLGGPIRIILLLESISYGENVSNAKTFLEKMYVERSAMLVSIIFLLSFKAYDNAELLDCFYCKKNSHLLA